MDHARAWRIATGAMLLAAGASELLPPATKYFTLTFGGALFGASAGPSITTVIREREVQAVQKSVAGGEGVNERGAFDRRQLIYGTLALGMAIGAGTLFLYPWLAHRSSPKLQASTGGAVPHNTLGHAIPPHVDPQLHVVRPGVPFVLNRARVTIDPAKVCQTSDKAYVSVPAAVRAVRPGESIEEPEYQLLDARGVPYQPVRTVALDAARGTAQHATPPPSIYREAIDFSLPASHAQGPLRLQAVLASGSGPEYRVTVSGAASNPLPSNGGQAACISPGGQGV